MPGISATPDEANARYFHVLVSGPSEVSFMINSSRKKQEVSDFFFQLTKSPYEGGLFKLELFLPGKNKNFHKQPLSQI